jgi:hypothetical protein
MVIFDAQRCSGPVHFRNPPNTRQTIFIVLMLLLLLTGTSSSLEVASCIPQIFGNDDIDVLSWDFGM